MSVSSSSSYWICKGYKEQPHPEYEVEANEKCDICGRERNSPLSLKKSSPILPIAAGAICLFALVGGVTWWLSRSQPQDNTQSVTPSEQPIDNTVTSTPPPTSNIDYSWEATRFTRGQRTLFYWKGNALRDEGITAFQEKDFSKAAKLFKRAVDADRNDPEVLILYNNALARQRENPLSLAVVVPIEGKATSAEEMLRGVAQAQHQFNLARGANEKLLEIVIANDGNKPENAEKVAQQLVQDQSILGVIGHNASSASEAGLKIYEQAGLAMISPTSTSTSLQGDVFFRTVPSDAAAGKKLAQYVADRLKFSRVIIFYNPNSSYSTSLQQAFSNSFRGQVLRSIDISDFNLNPGIEVSRSVFQEQAQAALLFPDTKYTSVAIEIAGANASLPSNSRLKLLGGDALYNPTTLTAGGETVSGLVLAVPWFAESPQAKNFKDAGNQQWGGLVNWRTAMSYDATQAFITAFSTNPSRASIIERLRQIELSQNQTSGDTVKFTTDGERQSQPVLVEAVKGGSVSPANSDFGFELVD